MRVETVEQDITWEPRYVGDVLFGKACFDTMSASFVRRIRWLMALMVLCALLIVTPFMLLKKVAFSTAGCFLWVFVLFMDVQILRQLCSFFQAYFIFGNLIAGFACRCIMYASDPVYGGIMAFLAIPSAAIVSAADAVPWHALFQRKGVPRVIYSSFIVIFGLVALKTYLGKFDVERVYDPVLFAGTHVETSPSAILVNCYGNALIFIISLVWESIVHPTSYVIWKSRLNRCTLTQPVHIDDDDGQKQKQPGDMRDRATSSGVNPMYGAAIPQVADRATAEERVVVPASNRGTCHTAPAPPATALQSRV